MCMNELISMPCLSLTGCGQQSCGCLPFLIYANGGTRLCGARPPDADVERSLRCGCRSAPGLAAGDVEGGPCDVAGAVGDEIGDQVADLIELAVTAERDDLGIVR